MLPTTQPPPWMYRIVGNGPSPAGMYARAPTLFPSPTSILKSRVEPWNGSARLPSLAISILIAEAMVGAALATAGVVFSMGKGERVP